MNFYIKFRLILALRKVKFALEEVIKAQKESRCVALLFL
jgi:hypothetical protein